MDFCGFKFKPEFGLQDILLFITLLITIWLARVPIHRENKKRKKFLVATLGRFVNHLSTLKEQKLSPTYLALKSDIESGKVDIDYIFLQTTLNEIRLFDRNDLVEIITTHSAYRKDDGLNKAYDLLKSAYGYSDLWSLKLGRINKIFTDMTERIKRDEIHTHELLDQIRTIILADETELEITNSSGIQISANIILDFFIRGSGRVMGIAEINTLLVQPCLESIDKVQISTPLIEGNSAPTPNWNKIVDILQDITREFQAQKMYKEKVVNTLNSELKELLTAEESFSKTTQEFESIFKNLL